MPDIGEARWAGGFWAERFEVCRDRMLPNMWSLLADPKRCHAWANFEIAAGVGTGRDGDHHGPAWHDGDLYKWLEGLAHVYALTRDASIDARMDEIIAVVARAQRGDGYLHTPTIIAARRGDGDAKEFRERLDFETYNLGHLMTAACVHHRATGKRSLLDVARRAGDFLVAWLDRSGPTLARSAVCPSHYMGVVELYRATRDPRYLELARRLVEIRDLVEDGTDHNQDRVPFREMREAVGHAVRANYLYAGVTDVYLETGDATLLDALEALWSDVVTQKLYVTGGTGALYDGASPDGSRRHAAIQLVHQAYGRDYQLPNVTAHNESCAMVGSLLWSWRMLLATGEARYADLCELTLCNGILATISLDGTRFLYVNPLRTVRELPFPLRWSRERVPYISCFCCPPNTVRTLAEASSYAYGLAPGELWVHLYGASVLDTRLPGGERVAVTQETDYPWDGAVRLRFDVAPRDGLSVRLRIPAWAAGATARVSGADVDAEPRPGSYLEIRRVWAAGDTVELRLPMRVRRLEAHPLVEETRGQVAVKRGPIVYCLESVDLPDGVRLENIILPLGAPLTPRRGEIAGARLVVLEGEALDAAAPAWRRGELYREARPVAARSVRARWVPYYAWGNRGSGEMSVWVRSR